MLEETTLTFANGGFFGDTTITYGDIDDNGTVNSADLIKLMQHLVGKITLTSDQKKSADMNNDGKISIIDLDSVQIQDGTTKFFVNNQTKNYYKNDIGKHFGNRKIKDITSIEITNPIMPGDNVTDKTFILDIKIILNQSDLINLEMQVINYDNWPERSLGYLCRSFDVILSI